MFSMPSMSISAIDSSGSFVYRSNDSSVILWSNIQTKWSDENTTPFVPNFQTTCDIKINILADFTIELRMVFNIPLRIV